LVHAEPSLNRLAKVSRRVYLKKDTSVAYREIPATARDGPNLTRIQSTDRHTEISRRTHPFIRVFRISTAPENRNNVLIYIYNLAMQKTRGSPAKLTLPKCQSLIDLTPSFIT
jgi:hypothetical protein